MQTRSWRWWLMTVLSLSVASYAMVLAFVGEPIYPRVLRDSFNARPAAIFLHALCAAIGLAIGPFQLDRRLLVRRRRRHRLLGKIYLGAVLIGVGIAGFYMSLFSHGGVVTHAAFGALAAATAVTTLMAYVRIRERKVMAHREWMIRSYALLFAAVTLRFELPLLIVAFAGSFTPAYQFVSWLCWLPNLAWAEWHIRRTRQPHATAIASLELTSTQS